MKPEHLTFSLVQTHVLCKKDYNYEDVHFTFKSCPTPILLYLYSCIVTNATMNTKYKMYFHLHFYVHIRL